MICTAFMNNCGETPAEETSVEVTSTTAGSKNRSLVSQAGLTIFPRQGFSISWTVDDDVERLLTGYGNHEVQLLATYRESLTARSRRLTVELRFERGSKRYVVASSQEEELT